MLVFKRLNQEKVVIDERITIVVIEAKDGSVRLGFDAPRDIVIDRFEVHEEKQAKRNSNRNH